MSIPTLDLSKVSFSTELRQESARASGENTPIHQESWPSPELVEKVKTARERSLSLGEEK